MTGASDSDLQQLAEDARSFFDAWAELAVLPLGCVARFTAAPDTRYRSVSFSVSVSSVRRVLVPGPLQIGLPRAGVVPESIPEAALGLEPGALAPGQTSFRLVVAAEALGATPGGTYWGDVTACVDPAHPQPGDESVPVWLVIP